MPVQVLQVIAWFAKNGAVPVLEWLLSQAGAAIARHEAAKAKKKGADPTEVKPTPGS